MTAPRRAVPAVASILCLACLGAPALALAGQPGGATAPSAPAAGGAEYGVKAATARPAPVVTALRVPSRSTAGRPPRVTLRVDERGVGTVNLQVIIRNLSTRRATVVANMGWSHTGRTLAVRWPHGATVPAGSYQVTVSAHDHHRVPLARAAHSSGRATLTVVAVPPPGPTPVPTPNPTVEPGVPTPAQTVAAGAVFPVAGPHSFGGPENRFGAPRSGHTHQGQDILTAEGTPDLAPLAGTVEWTGNQPGGAGYYVEEHTTIGFDLFFAHCQAGTFAVVQGQVVGAGQVLCHAGQTGDASAPHLHFEMWVGGWHTASGHPIDPLPYLEAWEHATTAS
jgi:murein DD-endopeptidase MepM/ murein hydrolase activator NlpD